MLGHIHVECFDLLDFSYYCFQYSILDILGLFAECSNCILQTVTDIQKKKKKKWTVDDMVVIWSNFSRW